MKLWKTTIEILTDYDPTQRPMELTDLAREADSGGALCISQKTSQAEPRDYGDEVLGFFDPDLGEEPDAPKQE